MPESLVINSSNKLEKYKELLPQLKSLVEGENNLYANLANVSAALKEVFNFWWVGFYLVDREASDQLVLGPFQGPIACTRIKFGKGVCGSSWKAKQTIIVPDVEKFPGHIACKACSSLSESEIVVPVFDPKDSNQVVAVLDVDSEFLEYFDDTDKAYLEVICQIVTEKWNI